MLQYERIDVSEGIDLNKSDKLKKCMICYYWYFKYIGSKYEHMFVINVMIYKWWFMI